MLPLCLQGLFEDFLFRVLGVISGFWVWRFLGIKSVGFGWWGCLRGFKCLVLWFLGLLGWGFGFKVWYIFLFSSLHLRESRVGYLVDGRAAGLLLRCCSGSILDICLQLVQF